MVKAIVGANWGDEGKGKLTDMMAQESDIIIRFQGGANAGHTIVNNYGKFALHTLPSGVFYDHTTSIIGNGVALNIPVLFNEIQSVVEKGVPMPKILISDRAQMVMPYHVLFDEYEEERLGKASFGSTNQVLHLSIQISMLRSVFRYRSFLMRKISKRNSSVYSKLRTFFLSIYITSLHSRLTRFLTHLWNTKRWLSLMFVMYRSISGMQ